MSTTAKVIVLVGDAACGKSSLASMFASNMFTANHFETVFEDYHADVEGPDGLVQLKIYDTSGDEFGEGYELRKIIYPEADAILICFDLTSSESVANVEKKWVPEVNQHCTNKPYFLVGCKKDLLRAMRKFSVDLSDDELVDVSSQCSLEEDSSGYESEEDHCSLSQIHRFARGTSRSSSQHVNHAMLWSMLLRCGAVSYFECSARTCESVFTIFSKVLTHLDKNQKKAKSATWPRNRSLNEVALMYEKERSKNAGYFSTMKKTLRKKVLKLKRSKSAPL